MQFWLAAGLKPWPLILPGTWSLVTSLDRLLIRLSSKLGSFVEIELERTADVARKAS